VPVGTGIRSALRAKCFWAKWSGVEKCSIVQRVNFGLTGSSFGEGWRSFGWRHPRLVSRTRDVANTELCLGHFDGCSLEHERLGWDG
jgi:hypothetical protein